MYLFQTPRVELSLGDINLYVCIVAVFGLDSGLGLFPSGLDPGKLYSPLMDMPDPRAPHHDPHMFSSVKKKCKSSYRYLLAVNRVEFIFP